MSTASKQPTQRVLDAIEEYRAGRMVILVDDEDRENEGDLCLAGEKVTPAAINFMAMHGRGLICLALDEQLIERLELPMMVQDNQASLGTAFTVSIEARHGVTTGISAKDRAVTVQVAIADDAQPVDLVSPGHIFPLKARNGGVLVRTGQTEGSVDLARLAGLKPAAVICEIMRDDGEMARMPDLEVFGEKHSIPILTVADLITYRLQQERIVERRSEGTLRPGVLDAGEPFAAYLYRADVDKAEYLALVRGDVAGASARGESVLVRVQSLCPIGDPLATRPDLRTSLEAIDEAGVGVFLYVFNQERTSLSRAFDKQVRRHAAPSKSADPRLQSEALRDFGLGAQVLADLGCRDIKLMSNSQRKIVGIEGFGIRVVERVPVPGGTNAPSAPELHTIEGGAAADDKG